MLSHPTQPECPKEELQTAFEVFDTHHNGYVSLSELTAIMANLGEGLTPAEIEGMTKAASADEDSQVNIRAMIEVLLEQF